VTVAARFLMRETPEVLVLKGAWDAGETFAWNRWFMFALAHNDERGSSKQAVLNHTVCRGKINN
jgi:hypothetical protein